jgi:energy-converting hydrogenase Eha subunit G
MPGIVLLGSRHFQEVAPGVAMDRAEVVSLSERLVTPAGTFTDVLKTKETTPLDSSLLDYKQYAEGVGLIQDGVTLLEEYGYI